MSNETQVDVNNQEVQNAVNEALQAQKKKKRKKHLIIAAIIVVLVIVVIAASSGGGNKDTNVEPINSSSDNNADITEKNTDADDPVTEEVKDQRIEAGNKVTTDDLVISYLSCDANYKGYNQYVGPATGNKVIRAEFEYENTSSNDVFLPNIECYADNKKCEGFYGADDYSSPALEKVSPGRTFTGVIYFEVPENSENIELEMEDDFWTDSKIIFVVK